MVAHELRAPVGAALVHAGLAEVQLGSRENLEDLRQAVTTVKHQMVRLDSILARLRRLPTGDLAPELKTESVDLADLLPRVVRQLSMWEPQAPSRVRVTCQGDVRGEWDATALTEVVTNLVGNGLKFGEGRPVDVRASSRGQGGTVELEVRDRGIGIAARDHGIIFERWQRAVPPRSFGGLGLGLWIVRNLVAAHGGTVKVASALGQGAVFTVSLPRLHLVNRQFYAGGP
ncbi:MAG TPA: HAMP domain-containing sensor histidine kinase [Polyangia bacterium]|nr:HAMP domain-containing sensor histidine kinase [Polyangia bacterium]